MQIAERVSRMKPSATLAVTQKAKSLKAAGVDVIGFGAGEPDFDTPEFIKEAAIEALRSGMTGYVPSPGLPDTREVIADKLQQQNGIRCRPEDVCVTVGAKHAVYLALHCLLDPGSGGEVILPTPAWVSYKPQIELLGGRVVELAAPIDQGFKVTPEQVEQAITDRTVAMILNSPSNPCGTVYTPDELRAITEVLKDHPQVTLISDEIYEKLIYPEIEPGLSHLSPGSIDSIADRTITINGLSKAYAMTGWRIGYVCAPGDDGEVIKHITKLQSQMTSSITSFCLPAVSAALRGDGEIVEHMRTTFAARARLVGQLLGGFDRTRIVQPSGAFYIFPDISGCFGLKSPQGRRIDSALSFAEALLEEANVAVVPGEDFGEIARGNVRMSFACSDEHIEQGCARMSEWIDSLS